MSESDPLRSPYLRRVTFLDSQPDRPADPPVHITHKLLLDGAEHGEVMARDDWQVFGEGDSGGTIVSFVAIAEHVTLKLYAGKNGDEHLSGTHICGIPVLTPSDHEWERLPVIDGQPELVRVFFFAREVKIVAAEEPVAVPA